MALVVIHGNYDVIPAASCFGEYSIRRYRSVCIDAFCLCCLNCRDDLIDLFSSKQAVLTTVWVQACYADLWLLDAGTSGY